LDLERQNFREGIDPIFAQSEKIRKVAVLGAGRCGRQILHCLCEAGYHPIAFEQDESRLAISRAFYERQEFPVLTTRRGFSTDRPNVQWSTSMETIAAADLIIESIVEDLPLKRGLVTEIGRVCSKNAILTTNSSYFLPSAVFQGVPQPERIASLHFHVPPWFATAVDIMPTLRTSPATMDALEQFIVSMGLTPIRLLREFPGYVFNSLLHPLLVKSLELAHRGVASPETVDLAWRAVTGMPTGPFGMMQQIGISTLSTILDRALTIYQDEGTRRARAFLEQWSGSLQATSDPPASLVPIQLSPQLSSARKHTCESNFVPFRVGWQELKMKPFAITPSPDSDPLQNGSFQVLGFQVLGSSPFSRHLSSELLGNDSTVSLEQIEVGKPIVWVMEPTDVQSVLSTQDYLVRIATLRRLLHAHFSQGKIIQLFVVLPLDVYGQLHSSAWGAPGMLRSVWMEQFAHDLAVESPVQIQILSIDFDEANAAASVARLIRSNLPEKQTHETNQTDGQGYAGLSEVYGKLHFHRDRDAWCIPKLIALSSSHLGLKPVIPHDQKHEPSEARLAQELRGSTWIVTGGGRGITAQLARCLGKFGVRLVLLGRTYISEDSLYDRSEQELAERKRIRCREAFQSGLSPAAAANRCDYELELSRNLQWLRQHDIDFEYHPIDVTSEKELQNFSTELRRRGIPVDGILHGAGFEQTTKLLRKTEESIRRTLACKIDSSKSLTSLMSRQSRWFIQCGSVVGFLGGAGQVDYAAANGFQACFAESLSARWPDVQVLTIAWPGWREVGMAARSASAWSLGRNGHQLISIEEGTSHFIELLNAKVSGCVLLLPPDEIPLAIR
jgi:3-hydroxybutyryl-CoA dehydrogenase